MILRIGIAMRFARRASASVALLVALAACGGGGEDAPPPTTPPPAGLQPTLASIQANVFTPSCAKSTCHTGTNAMPPAGLILDSGSSWVNLVNMLSSQNAAFTRVIPMNANDSLLIQKLENRAPVGGPMPDDGPPYLQQATINVIRQWIDDGAQNN
jgi:hypothetical protein